jgi:hypothetical protein
VAAPAPEAAIAAAPPAEPAAGLEVAVGGSAPEPPTVVDFDKAVAASALRLPAALPAPEPDLAASSADAALPADLVAAIVADALDFDGLVKRLRKTKAIKLSTKLAFKSESDDLLDGFRAYHRQRGTATLADLRRSYDSLFRKLHSMLRDADPPLDRDIDRSRAAIWEILADPTKFEASNLMAGA